MNAIELQLEAKILSALRDVCTVPVVGFFETALDGELKTTEVTSVQVKVSPRGQMYEPHKLYRVTVRIDLGVEACESKGGGLFVEEFEAVSGLLETLSTGDGCDGISTERFAVHGLQLGDDGSLDYDPTVGQWVSSWSCTITGCIVENNEEGE